MSKRIVLVLFALLVVASPCAAAKKALFDNAHAETAGNADWIIDDQQPIPSPAQSGIGPATARTYWQGAISSFGVDLVKRGYTVHTNTAAITYGNTANTYDLANYDVFIVPEPNTVFTAAEQAAILAYVQNGGGLIAISDHNISDRNNDGFDSPKIWNQLDPSHAYFGLHWGSTGDANSNIVQTSTNVAPSASDAITHGPVGTVTGLAFHNGTTFTIYPGSNPTVRGEVWMTGLAQTSTTGIMAASCQYGSGRVFMIGDSSPVDDGSATPGNTSIFDGWGEASGADSVLFLNATLWATRGAGAPGDVTPPVVTITSPVGGETWKVASAHAITWTATDNVGVTAVDLAYSTDGGVTYPNVIAAGIANSGTYSWTVPNTPSSTVRLRITARDAAANSAAAASAANLTIDRWTITASAGANGTITPSGAVGVAQAGSQAFTIAANSGFLVADVQVDAVSVGAVGSYTFSNVTANHTIAAVFSAAPGTFTITASAGAGGTITPAGAVAVAAGASQSFTIAASTGYHVVSVVVDGASAGAVTSYTFTNVQAAHTITANFSNAASGAYPLASGNLLETFSDIANWANNFTSGVGAACWAAVPVEGAGAIPDGFRTTTSTATFTTGTTGGVQKGVSPNPAGTIVLLSTGTTDNSTADAIDLRLDFTGMNAGTLSYNWATVFNSTGDRKGSLRVYTSVDGATFTELAGAAALNFTNNVAGSGSITSVALPATFNKSGTARLRFYYCNGTGGTTGSRPKVSIDNVAVTATVALARALPASPEPGPAGLALAPSLPNPAAGAATLGFTLPVAGHARLQVVDLAGRQVWTTEGEYAAGTHVVPWDGRSTGGAALPAGVYFVRLVSDAGIRTGRLVRL